MRGEAAGSMAAPSVPSRGIGGHLGSFRVGAAPGGVFGRHRQPNDRLGAATRNAQQVHLAPVRTDDLLDDRQAEARALAALLGREERLENLRTEKETSETHST